MQFHKTALIWVAVLFATHASFPFVQESSGQTQETPRETPEIVLRSIRAGQIKVRLEPTDPKEAGRAVPWSPKGNKVWLKKDADWLVGEIQVGKHKPIKTRFRFDEKESQLDLDLNGNGKFESGEQSSAKASASRGKNWYSHSASLVLKMDGKSDRNYPVSLWFVHDPNEPDAAPVIRWSRRGWHQGKFELNGKTYFALITDGDSDGLFTKRDSWGLGKTTKDLFQYRNCAFRIGSHAWLGEEIPFQVVDCDPQGSTLTIQAFDLGITRKEDEERKDPYAEDRKFARAKKPIQFMKSYDEAIKLAAKLDKPILIDFQTEWCGSCRVMEQLVFTAKPVVAQSSDYVFLKLDGDKQKELVKKYGVKAYPTTILLSANEEVLQKHTGYLGVRPFLKFLESSK